MIASLNGPAVPSAPARPAPAVPLEEAETTTLPSLGATPASGGPRLRLRVIVGPATGVTFDLGAEGAMIGRSHDNAVFLPDERLSRHHARVTWQDGHFWLEDLGSTNGTSVNGQRLMAAHALQPTDSVTLGNTAFDVELLG
jgi:pSer/pThr/pTyr-binding forkhead associated (FHA) protein